jgi:hypothetical protein
MALFGRKKDKDFDDEGGYSDEEGFGKGFGRRDRKLTKDIRDLKPGNRKKRKEPPKPWGKKERMIVFIILLVSVVASAILAIGANNKAKFRVGLPKFDLNSLNIFKEQTIIVGKK